MPTSLTSRVVRLADQLGELRLRLKEAARFEVAEAVAKALAEATRSIICGPAHMPQDRYQESSPWDDPWQDPRDRGPSWADEDVAGDERPSSTTADAVSLQFALMTGFGAARWSLTRTGQPFAALGFAAFITIAVLVAGDRIKPLLDVVTAAQELLTLPSRRL